MIVTIDPNLRNTGIVLMDRLKPVRTWTLTTSGKRGETLEDLAGLVHRWAQTNHATLESGELALIEQPPPRAARAYIVSVPIACGIWLGILHPRLPTRLVDVNTWQRAQLGPSRTWLRMPGPKGKRSSKLTASVKCKSLGVDLPNEHTRDAYLMGRWWETEGRRMSEVRR